MHRLITRLLCSLAFLVTIQPCEAGEAVIRLEIISLSKVAAMQLLGDSRMVTEPAAMLRVIEGLKSRREAELVATPSLQGTLPFRTKTSGKVFVEVDAGGAFDKLVHLNIAVEAGKPKQSCRLVTAADVKSGVPKFLGTLEPLDTGSRDRTWLVFLHLQ